ncbi:MAG: two-component regulator propeller domain-containing protein [Bacteroidota bacterium]
MRISLLLFIYILLLPKILFGQTGNLHFDQLSTKEGLSHSIVTCTLQDKEGFMWIGTQDGLNRFDGYNFLLFEHDPSDKTSISNNAIRCIYEDWQGHIWVGTAGGLNKFDKTTNTFRTYQHDPANVHSLSHDDIKAIYEDRLHTLWIGTYVGLDKLNQTTNTFTLYEHVPGHPDKFAYNLIMKIYEDRQGHLWLATTQGISQFDRKRLKFRRFVSGNNGINAMDDRSLVRDILEDSAGILWIATSGNGLVAFDRKTKKSKVYLPNPKDPYSISSIHIMSLLEDSFGTLWIGTQDKGLCWFDRSQGKFISYQSDPALAKIALPSTITSIYEDRSKVLWLGTYEGGLYKMDLLRKKFRHVVHNPTQENSIRKNDVYALYQDHTAAIWVGSGEGIDKMDRSSGKYSHYTYPTPAKLSLWENNTKCIYEDQAGNLWIGLFGGGLRKFNRLSSQFDTYVYNPTDTNGLPHGIVNTICEDKQKRLWLGTRYGLTRFEENKKKFRTYLPTFLTTRAFDITTIVEDVSGKLWLAAGQYGLVTFDPTTGRFTQYAYKEIAFRSSTKVIKYLYEDRVGLLWLCLQDGGLMYLNRKTGRCDAVLEPKALRKIVVNGILEDGKGNLWLSTSKNGLYQFNPSTKALAIYDALDGLQANEFNGACCKSSLGEMCFGGKNGCNIFHPDSIQHNLYAPPVAISSFKVFDKSRSFSQEITLPYKDNFISFDFVALSYAFPSKNKYAYQLEGFDQEWVQAGTRRYASFTNLEPGEYVFRVKAANHDGTWNEKGASVKIIISPPLWRTMGAYFLYVALFIGLFMALRYNTLKQVRLKNNLILKGLEAEKMMELDQLKSRFFTSISHEFRTPLTLILSPLEQTIAAKSSLSEPSIRLMHRNARRLLELINQLLDISKLEASQMKWEVSPGDIIPILKANVFAFLSLAESKQIKLTFESNLDSLRLRFDKDKVEKIVTNLLANAIKFTPALGEVTVTVWVRPAIERQWIILEVKDTGIGIPADRINKVFDRFYQVDSSHTREFEGTGIGLALTKELVELQQGTIRVTSTQGIGTCFIVELPLLAIDSESEVTRDEPLAINSIPVAALTWQEHDGQDAQESQLDAQAPLLLVVEDNTDLRTYIRNIFQHCYRIIEASHGQEGLQMALETIPDLIVSDWMMPKMDGLQLCQQLKTDERTSHIPIILLTAKATVQSKIEGLETGADDYITKPFHTEELFIRAKNLIAQRQSLRERWSKDFALAPLTVVASVEPTPARTVNAVDEKFLQRVIGVVESNISDPEFTIDLLGKEVGMSHANLYRKLKALTDQSPGEFLRYYRLQKAAQLLTQGSGNVSEVAYQVGFTHLSYFTKAFRQVYGLAPSEYAAAQQSLPQL